MRRIFVSDWDENGEHYSSEETEEAFILYPNERVINIERVRELVEFQHREKKSGDLAGRENTLRIIWKELGIE